MGHQTTSIETKEKDASDVKMKIETKQEIRESDAFKKDIPKKRNNSNSRKKTQEFKPNDLDELRGDFAMKQGVKETKDINTVQTVNKQADTDISPLEVKTASSNESANKETVETPVMREQICVHDILVTEPCEKCDESQSHNTLKNYMPTKEERKKKGRKSTKKTKEEKTASLEGSMIKEITNREEEKNIKGEIQVDKVNIESTKEIISIDKSKSKESKTQTTQVLKESCKECVHDISISDFCKGCADNQKSLDRRSSKKPKENYSKNSKKVTDTEEVKLLEKKEIKNIKKEKAEVKGGKMKIIESKKDVSMTEQDEKNKTIIEEKNDHNNSNKKTDNLIGVLESKETDVEAKALPKKKWQ